MGQPGHADAAFTVRVYAHAMRPDAGDLERLRTLVDGADWATTGRTQPDTSLEAPDVDAPDNYETLTVQGLRVMGAAGFEPATSRV
jgi:hypothetical protein